MKKDRSMERIESITLDRILPDVFLNEKIPDSDIWRKEVRFDRGNFYMIEAASGTGKSSLCSYIFGSRTDYSGKILFNNTDIASFGIDRWQALRRNNIAYLPQELSLFPELTAIQNIHLKSRLTDAVSDQQIDEWLHELGIDSRTNHPVGKMSIGQQQRVAIIRAICQPFDFLLLDEPVSHLDDDNNIIAAKIISQAARNQGAAIIATSVGNQLKLQGHNLIKL